MNKEDSLLIPNDKNDLVWRPTVQAPANPAAGDEYSGNLPAVEQLIEQVTFQFDTDANAASRHVWLNLLYLGSDYPLGFTGKYQTASQSFLYNCFIGAPQNLASPVNVLWMPLPNRRNILDSVSLQIKVDNIQVGDQISNVKIYLRTWRGYA